VSALLQTETGEFRPRSHPPLVEERILRQAVQRRLRRNASSMCRRHGIATACTSSRRPNGLFTQLTQLTVRLPQCGRPFGDFERQSEPRCVVANLTDNNVSVFREPFTASSPVNNYAPQEPGRPGPRHFNGDHKTRYRRRQLPAQLQGYRDHPHQHATALRNHHAHV